MAFKSYWPVQVNETSPGVKGGGRRLSFVYDDAPMIQVRQGPGHLQVQGPGTAAEEDDEEDEDDGMFFSPF